MKFFLGTCLLGLLFMYGCGKEHPDNKPVLNFEKVNTTTLPNDAIVTFEFKFQSKVKVDSIYIKKIVPDCSASEFEAMLRVPDYPVSLEKGDLNVSFYNGGTMTGLPGSITPPLCGEDDLATFKFVLRDVNGNFGDTVESPIITILR